MNLLPSALPGRELALFPLLLVFVSVLLLSTATLAFFIKERLSLTALGTRFAGLPGLRGNTLGAVLGATTPFCTCTAVPLFVGMLEADAPLGPAVSFLLASPTINLGAIIVLLVVFGFRTALFYATACLGASVAVGWLLGRIPRQNALHDYLWIAEDEPAPGETRVALKRAAWLGGRLTRKLLPWLVAATASGLLLDALVPTSAVAHLGRWGVVLGIPLAALLGSVVYADILLLIPLGYALIQHGASTPVVLTFMLAASGLSLPELVVLSRILRPRVVLLFAAATVSMYIMLGFGFTSL